MYPYQEHIKYEDDSQYRDLIMRVILQTVENEKGAEPCPETLFARFLDEIYESTKDQEILQDFYIKAAGFMMSEDPGIGLAVLFSYDYFSLFHYVLCDFYNKIELLETTPSVINLTKKMTR